jgi:hypothetical protein
MSGAFFAAGAFWADSAGVGKSLILRPNHLRDQAGMALAA